MINVHPDDHYYLAFHVSSISQVQPTHMSQEATTLSFTFSELMIIVFGPILSSHLEPSSIYGKTAKDTALLAFYIIVIFRVFKTDQKQYIILPDYFFPRMV